MRPAPAPTSPTASLRILIIGGGIAGLSCGSYLQMNGFSTEILEAAAAPGGLCTAWERGPYLFDGCLRWLVGTRPGSSFHQIWQELGALGNRRIFDADEIVRIETADGRVFSAPANLEQLRQALVQVAPEDTRLIDKLVKDARRCEDLEPPIEKPFETMTPLEKMRLGLRYFRFAPVISRWKGIPLTDYVQRYRNPFVREILMVLAGDPRVSALVLVMVLAYRCGRSAGYVAGGSRALAQTIAQRYQRLGGTVRCHTAVESILVTDGRATGVSCVNGTSLAADMVVSCADGYSTVYQMLGGKFTDEHVRFPYEQCEPFPAMVQVSLGINRTFPDAPHTLSLGLTGPLRVDDQTAHGRLEVTIFNAESGLCPAGKTLVTVRAFSRCEFWMKLREGNPERYAAAKEALLQEVIARLNDRFPGLKAAVEQADVATPATFVRHTGNWQGSYEGWLPTPRILGRRLPRTLPGLDGFYMAGHWVEPGGGLPFAAYSGRYVAQLICARYGRGFQATAR